MKGISVFKTVEFFLFSEIMATLKNKRSLAVAPRETQEINRNSQLEKTSLPEITDESITQVFEEIENRVTKKLAHEFSRSESQFLGSLFELDKFLLNPQLRALSGTTPETSRNNDLENQEPNDDRSQSDPQPKVEFSTRRTSNSIDSVPG